jgi:hypothetical protein
MADYKPIPGITSKAWEKLFERVIHTSRPTPGTLPKTWTFEQKVAVVAAYLAGTIWPDIENALEHAPLAALSLTLAVIDYLGGFLTANKGNHLDRYTEFIQRYIPNHTHRAKDIYYHLRSAFLHNLVLKTPDNPESTRFLLLRNPNLVDGTMSKGVHLFSISTFAQDVIDGAAKYLFDVLADLDSSENNGLAHNFAYRFDLGGGEAAIIRKKPFMGDIHYFSDAVDPRTKHT